MLLKLKWLHVLGDFSDKEIVVNNLLWVGAQQIIVIRESATWLTRGKFEVAELLACFTELVIFWNCHDG